MTTKEPVQAHIDRIAEEALMLSGSKRLQFLKTECAGDEELFNHVNHLLEVDPDGLTFLQRPIVDFRQLGTTRVEGFIGPYKVIRELGRGGMGRVLLAYQETPIKRHVAIKLLPSGIFEADRIRFQAEQNILAALNHSHICKIYESGETAEGLPYFLMEYVEGPDLATFCDQERLNLDQRLDLFLKVAGAVAYAHQKGVIHCDLKPSNILVTVEDGKPIPKIIDFGIAKLSNPDVGHTVSGIFQGSLGYLSPEQVAGTCRGGKPVLPDTRTDCYALGVILYELLTGRKPIVWDPETPFLAKCGFIASVDPTPLSVCWKSLPANQATLLAFARSSNREAWFRQLRKELEWITTKALQKKPDARYASPLEMQNDLLAFLKGKPVSVNAPSLFYRTHKFAMRHWAPLTIALLAFFLALGIPTAGWIGKTAESKVISAELERVDQARRRAEQVARYMVELFPKGGSFAGADRRAFQTSLSEQAIVLLQQDALQEPLLRGDLLNVLGQIQLNLGQVEPASESLAQALEIRIRFLGPNHEDSAETQHHLARLALAARDHSKALQWATQATECRKLLFGEASPQAMESQKLLTMARSGLER